MIHADDPRVTAYALGALDVAEKREVEAAMDAKPAVRAAVEQTRTVADVMRTALADEPATLTSAQRDAILVASFAKPAVRRERRWVPFVTGFATAASLLFAVGLAVSRHGGGGGSAHYGEPMVMTSGDASGGSAPAKPQALAATDGSAAVTYEYRPFVARESEVGAKPVRQDAGRGQAIDRLGRLHVVARGSGGGGGATASAYVVDGKDGDFRGRTENLFTGSFQSRLNCLSNEGLPNVLFEYDVEIAQASSFPPGAKTRWVQTAAGYVLVAENPSSGETYALIEESGFVRVSDAPLSTFSADVDTASYANVRRMLRDGQRPPVEAIRVEEMLNYFKYEYAQPKDADPFAVHLEVAACPWNLTHRLVRVGIQGRDIEKKARPPMNLVFLVDVSGSMDSPNKLPLVQASMRMLLEELNERDSVAIVVYAGASGLVLPPTWCEHKATIQKAIDDLKAGGSTNGAAGITLAYEVAMQRFSKDAVNRVVLATDGDFNVGVTSHEALLALITEKAKSGVFLTCLGYGMGNLKDSTLELLADKGNGNYGYVDSTREARKVLVEGASGTLVTIAKDVKFQVEFNPATVASYRLVGYDNRRLADKDFADDTKDAGEVGAGHSVTALYEVIPVGSPDATKPGADAEPLRYHHGPQLPPGGIGGGGSPGFDSGWIPFDPKSLELLTVKVRWKEPTGTTSTKREFPLVETGAAYPAASRDFKFASSVAAFAMLLKGSKFAGNATLDAVAEWAAEGLPFDPSGYRAEFADLVAKAKSLPK